MTKNLVIFSLLFFPLFISAQDMQKMVGTDGNTYYVSSRGTLTVCADCSERTPMYQFGTSSIFLGNVIVEVSELNPPLVGGPSLPYYWDTYRDTFTVSDVYLHLNKLMSDDKSNKISDPYWGNRTDLLPGEEKGYATKTGNQMTLSVVAAAKVTYSIKINQNGLISDVSVSCPLSAAQILFLFRESNF